MKIAFIGGRDIHTLGGIENYMYNLATGLSKLGHESVVYCESDRNETEFVNGFKVIHQRSVGGRFLCKILLSYRATLRTLFKERDTAVFHYNAWPPSLASWMARLCGKTVILQGHGLEWKRTKYSPAGQRIMKAMERITARMHRNLIMVSREQSDLFLGEYGRECVTIPTAVNIPVSTPSEAPLAKWRLKKEEYFLFLGRLVQDKNPDCLIDAFLQSGIDGKKLVVAGDNPHDAKYVKKLHALAGNDPRIVFTGAVYDEDKEALLAHCHAFCIPSTLEGLPITLLEAMSCGRICIASDIPANHEALGESGIWVEPENAEALAAALRDLAAGYEKFKYQGILNRARVEQHFTWEKITGLYLSYLLSLTGRE